MSGAGNQNPIEWARRVNRRWIVRGGLGESAEKWLNYLETEDPGRLQRSGENALAMGRARDRTEDPKPWFYAGLFSLATPDEARRFLEHHWLTAATIPALADSPELSHWFLSLAPDTKRLGERLRSAVTQLP